MELPITQFYPGCYYFHPLKSISSRQLPPPPFSKPVRDFVIHWFFFCLGDISPTSNTVHGGLTPVGRPILLNEYIRKYRSYLQAVFTPASWGYTVQWWQTPSLQARFDTSVLHLKTRVRVVFVQKTVTRPNSIQSHPETSYPSGKAEGPT